MKEKFLILAYPGLGKSWVAEHYKNVSDFEFQHYRYDYGQYKNLPLEQLKGKTSLRTPNSEWPQNFFAALNSEIENVDIVMVPFSTTVINNLNLLNKMVKIIIYCLMMVHGLIKMIMLIIG